MMDSEQELYEYISSGMEDEYNVTISDLINNPLGFISECLGEYNPYVDDEDLLPMPDQVVRVIDAEVNVGFRVNGRRLKAVVEVDGNERTVFAELSEFNNWPHGPNDVECEIRYDDID